MESIQSALEAWFFQAVSENPTAFAIFACSYSPIKYKATAFPAFADGEYPSSVTEDHRGFSPLMDMRYGLLAWPLHCDQQVLTTVTTQVQVYNISVLMHMRT
jgi:hypothetical protein